MTTDLESVRERARVTQYEPPVFGLDRPVWAAEDPETGCLGLGDVEAEAVGNLVSVVARYERDGGEGTPTMKVPGRVIARPAGSPGESLADRLRSLF